MSIDKLIPSPNGELINDEVRKKINENIDNANISVTNVTTKGGGTDLIVSKSGNELELRSVVGSAGVATSENANGEIVVRANMEQGNNINITQVGDALRFDGASLEWTDIDDDYTVQGTEIRINANTSTKALTVQLKTSDNYPDEWNGVNIKNNGLNTIIVKKPDNNDLVVIKSGSYYSIYYSRVTNDYNAINLMGVDILGVVDFDVSSSPNIALDNTYTDKLVNIVQTGETTVAAQVQLTTHDKWETGDKINITASESYTSNYFAVYYSNKLGQVKSAFPSNSIIMTRTNDGWDISLDGRFTNVLVAPAEQTTFSGNYITDNTKPVSGFVFADRPGVEYVTDDEGRRLIKVDTGLNAFGRRKRTLYLRTDAYTVTEDDVQKDIFIQAEPMVKNGDDEYVLTVTLPSIEVFKKYYWIPGVNDDDKNDREYNIQDFSIACWCSPEQGNSGVHKLVLKSDGNSVAWETTDKIADNEGCYIFRRDRNTDESLNPLFLFNMMRIESGSSISGPMGDWSLQTSGANHVYALTTPTPPQEFDINKARNITLRADAQNEVYVSIDRATPVITNDTIDNLQLIRVVESETETELPKVQKLTGGIIGSGFSRCNDNSRPGDEILQIASGTYTLTDIDFVTTKAVGDTVYVGIDGKLTTDEAPYIAGWVIDGGVIIDIDLYNQSVKSGNNDAFDVLTTRVLKVHEGPDNPNKFTQWAVDGNFNTEVHAVGDTHYYAKNKDTDELIEAYQVMQDGVVEFKHGVEFTNDTRIDHRDELGLTLQGDSIYGVDKDGYEHFFIEQGNFNVKSKKIQKVRDGVADDDAVNVRQLDELKAQVTTLTQLIVQQSEHIHSLEESNGESYGSFELYSSSADEVRIDLTKLNGEIDSQTITLGGHPPPGPNPPPDPNHFTVYFGWDINSRALINAADILNYQSTDERSANTDVAADNLLETTWSLTRSDNSVYKYIYIAYPKDVVDPNPTRVEYSGFIAEWLVRELTIDGTVYMVIISELPNISDQFDIKLHY